MKGGEVVNGQKLIISVIRIYQRTISFWIAPSCRFIPSCSQYMLEAVEKHGMKRGLWLGLKRIGRCRPGGKYGYDPVP
ncbi:MAG: membrane protein insertion efficiency factor YidD [Syntrophomonadaceae bacterium]|nr:membrane protein insertion efficiency factor YidD [Syntrophomonadaceae bacterium]